MTSLIAAAVPLPRQLLDRDLLRGRLDGDGADTFTLLIAEPVDEHLAVQVRFLSLRPLLRLTDDMKH